MKALIRKMFSLRFSILAIVLLCWLVPTILLGTFLGTRFFTALQEKTEVALMTAAEQAQVLTTENLNTVVTLAKDIVYDGVLAEAVADYESKQITYEEYFLQCRSYLERKYGRERLLDFALFFRMGNPTSIFFTTDDYPESVYFQLNVLQNTLDSSEALDTGTRFFSHGGRMYMARNLFNTQMEKFGMVVLGLNAGRLFAPAYDACEAMGMRCFLRVGEYSSDPDTFENAADGMSEDGETLLYTLNTSTRDYALRFQIQADKRAVYREMETYRSIMWWMFALLIPLCVLMTVFVNRRIIHPIWLLNDASMRMRGGELGVTVPMHGNDELGQLGSAFSSMSLRLKYLVDKSYKEEIALKDARIQALQSRVNSHFLNNALETINWQARMEGSETISTMVEALSCLLNASMDRNERHLVPLSEELVVADAYFYFIGLRFGDKLNVWKHIEQGLDQVLVPRLAIQTLVENAIEHGVAPTGGGRIHLLAYRRGDRLTVDVLNNGKLLNEEDLARIRRLLKEDSEPEGHMGVRNVARRLRLLYGDAASITIRADEHGQTVASFTIPAVNEGEETARENK